MTSPRATAPTADDIDRHSRAQRVAYRCAEEVAAGLEAGVTEREAARRMRAWLEARGVTDWFHVPFAWFGDRTAFHGFRQPLQFFPTDRRLARGMAFILDCGPIVDGTQVDIGYAGALGDNAIVRQIRRDLLAHRALILDAVRAGTPLAEIYRAVDRLALKQGLRNRHRKYPFSVLAHRLVPAASGPKPIAFGFGVRSLRALTRSIVTAKLEGWSPLWAGGARSDHAPVAGLWAVEPHLAFGDVGAKFEEILVVPDDPREARWLDDDVPHLRELEPGAEARAA